MTDRLDRNRHIHALWAIIFHSFLQSHACHDLIVGGLNFPASLNSGLPTICFGHWQVGGSDNVLVVCLGFPGLCTVPLSFL